MLDTVAPREYVDAWSIRNGVEPYSIEEAVFAEYESGFILLARGPFDARLAVREAGARMTGVEVQTNRPLIRRTGWLGNDHRDLAALTPNVIMVADGEPAAIAAVLARARGDASTPAALAGPEAAALYRDHSYAPLLIIAPRHLELPPGFPTSTLLAQERGLALAVQPRADDELRCELDLRGQFPADAGENFRTLAEAVGGSQLGAALGLADALPTLRVQSDAAAVILHLTVRASALAMGLRVLFFAEIRELIGEPNSAESEENTAE